MYKLTPINRTVFSHYGVFIHPIFHSIMTQYTPVNLFSL